jgi:UrcA family protein
LAFLWRNFGQLSCTPLPAAPSCSRAKPFWVEQEAKTFNTIKETTMDTITSARKHSDTRTFVLATFAAAWFAMTATGARAAEPTAEPGTEPTKQVVNYGDLNLSNPRGVEELYQRIAAAARRVCDSGESRSLQVQTRDWMCKKQSIARAVAVIDQPALTALHAQKTGQPTPAARMAKH